MESRESIGRSIRAAVVAGLVATPLLAQVTQRVCVASDGTQAGSGSGAAISADGRYVSFASGATNLVPGDTNHQSDVFVRDRETGATELVSRSTGGTLGNQGSFRSCLSSDGRFVAFESFATNLVVGDTNGLKDIFVRDRQAGTTELVSFAMDGEPANDDSSYPSISADGRYVAFESDGTDLVPGDTNLRRDVFLLDRQTGAIELVTLADDENPANYGGGIPSISADGRFVAFESGSSNLVASDTSIDLDIYVRDRLLGTTEWISLLESGPNGAPSISGDGRFVAYRGIGIAGGTRQIFVRDRQLGVTERASETTGGTVGNGNSYEPAISADGRYVAFKSAAMNLVAGDTNGAIDVFVRDLQTPSIVRVDVSSAGEQANAGGVDPSISADGRFVAFESASTNLVPGDTSAFYEVFVHDREGGPTFTSLCEPGVSGVIACPCGNAPSGAGRGCDNSAATGGAALTAAGGTYLSSDSLVFTTSGEKPTATSVLLQGTMLVASGAVYGQGVRCVGGTLKRLFTKTASGGSITAPNFGVGDSSVSARSAAKGNPISPGQTRTYLVFYRDPTVLGGCPSGSTFNATQTGLVSWAP